MIDLRGIVDAACGRKKAQTVLKNAFIVNVLTQSIEKNDVAISNGIIAGIGKYEGETEVDCTGLFVSPGFVDAHVHIESSMLTPENFSSLVASHGVTTVVADPHETANVLGASGIKFMLDNSDRAVGDIWFMLPSCVPATDFEDNGATLTASVLKQFMNHPRVLGLGEVMNVPGVTSKNDDLLEKLALFQQKHVDGHCPRISDKALNACMSCSITTDHECESYEEALKKVNRGMYVMIRQGSAAKNLKDVVSAVNKDNFHRFLFCTDDRHADDLVRYGSVDHLVRMAIRNGLEPLQAFTIATINAAQCYGLNRVGAVVPGYKADLVVFDDLNKVKIKLVMKNGEILDNWRCSEARKESHKDMNYLNMAYVEEADFKVKAQGTSVNVIRVVPNSIETRREKHPFEVQDGHVTKVKGEDVLKIGVFERHNSTGKRFLAYAAGFGLKNCAIAQTISHDSHNVVVMGDDDKDMAVAVNSILNIGGGIVIVSQGKVLNYLSLPIAGLMSRDCSESMARKLNEMKMEAEKLGARKDVDPFLTLSFMALPVVPELKITPRGLYDGAKNEFVNLFVD